jgi:hypothetical protein
VTAPPLHASFVSDSEPADRFALIFARAVQHERNRTLPFAAAELFEAGGASLTPEKLAIDGRWHNGRTVAWHNPVVFKRRAIGADELNGKQPPCAWSAGARTPRERGS